MRPRKTRRPSLRQVRAALCWTRRPGASPPLTYNGPHMAIHRYVAPPAEHDPNDRRTLYERLKEQREAKQEVWEEEHKFKNQMDHWKLGEDDVAFEEVGAQSHFLTRPPLRTRPTDFLVPPTRSAWTSSPRSVRRRSACGKSRWIFTS